ncbi:hypothetical protein TL16_g13148 [Triparma laevis f. inornata]|uniref:Uncharacterized protein n=1 Tax=Triparma laevis f. inornata TaxID=1714386 RepID=A0A9W7EXH6_9STRA|nr:hypothetical protein TL16_g13148 [Triparma laevis f. inornata]
MASSSCLLLLGVALVVTQAMNTQQPISWKHTKARALPVVSNFLGATNLRPDGLSLGPITLGGFNGNMYNSTISIDDSPFQLSFLTWESCSGTRESDSAKVITRMPMDERVIMQSIKVKQSSSKVSLRLDGPFFRTCDDPDADTMHDAGDIPGYPSSCGWGLALPTDREHFTLTLVDGANGANGASVMVVEDTLSKAVSASSIVSTCGGYVGIEIDGAAFTASAACSEEGPYSLQYIVAVAETAEEAMAILSKHAGNFRGSFERACSDWAARWESAFDPTDEFFSGHLPTLTTKDTEMSNLYTWAANAQVSLMRTSMLSAPRQYVISEGASNSYDGSTGMGGSGQFIWDISFSAATLSLLDPEVALDILKHVVSNADFSTHPIGVPQAWDGYLAYPNTVGGGQYAFDYIASYIYLQSYFTLTGDFESLTTPLANNHEEGSSYSPLDFMRRIASNYIDFPKAAESPFLADYGSDKRSFLEAAPTYTNVIAGLQGGNAGMQFSLANLLESLGGEYDDEVNELRMNATAIVEDVVAFQYREGGFFSCLNATEGQGPVDVMALADHIYIGQGLGLIGDAIDLLPADVRESMCELFFSDYLSGNGWVRAISLNDASMANVECDPSVCTDLDKVSMRSDWTATGGYGGLFGAAVEALADLEGGLEGAVKALKSGTVLASAEYGTMPSQGIAVMSTPMFNSYLEIEEGEEVPEYAFAPAFPEYFDEAEQASGFPSEWPNTARSIQNAEGSIVDVYLRTLFGWRPSWSTWKGDEGDKEAAIEGAIWMKDVGRYGFEGELSNVRTPYGDITLSVGDNGVKWKWTQ